MLGIRILCGGAIILLCRAEFAVGQTTHVPSRDHAPLSARQLVQEAHRLISSRAADESQRVRQILQLVRLTRRISDHPRARIHPALRRAHVHLVHRLHRERRQLEADLQRARRRPRQIKIDVPTLAQLNAAVGAAAAPQGRNGGLNFPDYGPLLVQLIQDTISPLSWDVNGGNSSIFYYRPGRALVVRAPHSAHGKIAPLLGQLQRR